MRVRWRGALLPVQALVDLVAAALLFLWPQIVHFAPYVGIALIALGMLAIAGSLSTYGDPKGRISRLAHVGIPILHIAVGAILAIYGLESFLLSCGTPAPGAPGGGCASYWDPYWEIVAPGLALTVVGLLSILTGRRA